MAIQPHLSPPWFTLWNKIDATIGNNQIVNVEPLITSSHPFTVPITIADHSLAVATASIINLHHQIGDIIVEVQVKDTDGDIVKPLIPDSVEQLGKLAKKVLSDNRWFKEVVVQGVFPHSKPAVFLVFSKAVIQFFNDDLSDLYNNYNNVVAFVFRDVLHQAPGGFCLYTSTAEQN